MIFPDIVTSTLTPVNISTLIHVCSAMLAGGLIGLERSYHGRPAGFRTHTLVCLASCCLMLVTLYQSKWITGDAVHIDPTRMAQGIMTGIGFLGAGVIYKEGISVRGLTTAASIWTTAAIGILMGVGLFFPGTVATIFTLGVLSYFHHIEHSIPKRSYIHSTITFDRDRVMSEADVRAMLEKNDLHVGNVSYHTRDGGKKFEYRMVIRTMKADGPARMASVLSTHPEIREFEIAPSGD